MGEVGWVWGVSEEASVLIRPAPPVSVLAMGLPHRHLCTASRARDLSRLLLPLLVTQLWGEAGNRAWREVPGRVRSHHQPSRTAPPLGTPAPTRPSRGGSGLIPPCSSPSFSPGDPDPSPQPGSRLLSPRGLLSRPLTNPGPSLSPILSPPLHTPPVSPQSCSTALPSPLSPPAAHIRPLLRKLRRVLSSPPGGPVAFHSRSAPGAALCPCPCPSPSRPTQFALQTLVRSNPASFPFPAVLLLPLPFGSCRTPSLHAPRFPGFGSGPPSSGPKPSPCPACSDLHPLSFSSRGGGAAPQKRHWRGPCGLWRSLRTRFAALAGLPLQWPLVPLRGRPGGQELGAHSRALPEQQVRGDPRGSYGRAVEAGPWEGAGRSGALESLCESVLEDFP